MNLYGVEWRVLGWAVGSFQDTRGQHRQPGGGGALHTTNMTKIIRTGL